MQEVCRLMLFRERLRPGVPVPHTDLIKHITVRFRHIPPDFRSPAWRGCTQHGAALRAAAKTGLALLWGDGSRKYRHAREACGMQL